MIWHNSGAICAAGTRRYVIARSQRVARMRARWQAPRRSNPDLL